jgi:Leucine-rich repeat (LRR) protein
MFVFLSLTFASFTSKAQVIEIPDAHFKSELVSNKFINTNLDDEIQLSEAMNYTGHLDVSNASITDLSGIENFTSITSLDCRHNNLYEINFGLNNNLTRLSCGFNNLLDLDVSMFSSLQSLDVQSNDLMKLKIYNNVELARLLCQNNQLENLDLSNNLNLIKLNCSYNRLLTLDLSHNNNLSILDCSNNFLETLNLANGNNSAMAGFSLNAVNNNLSCIKVDNLEYSKTNWTLSIDANSFYSVNCTALPIKEVSVSEYTVFPNPTDGGSVSIFLGGEFAKVSVKVVNTSGAVVLNNSYKNKEAINLDLDVTPGVYMVTVQTDLGNNYTHKLLVQ